MKSKTDSGYRIRSRLLQFVFGLRRNPKSSQSVRLCEINRGDMIQIYYKPDGKDQFGHDDDFLIEDIYLEIRFFSLSYKVSRGLWIRKFKSIVQSFSKDPSQMLKWERLSELIKVTKYILTSFISYLMIGFWATGHSERSKSKQTISLSDKGVAKPMLRKYIAGRDGSPFTPYRYSLKI